MKTFLIPCIIALLLTPLASGQFAAGNVRAAQRAGTFLVDIDYDVSGTSSPVNVGIQGSADGGSTWTLPLNTLTGAVGSNIMPGTDLRITWDAGADWSYQMSAQTKFRITVSDLPLDFVLIPAGPFTMGNTVAEDTDITDAPTRVVNVSAFYMAQNLVTLQEWDKVRTWGLDNGYFGIGIGSSKDNKHPVQRVSWWDVVNYCNARSEMEGLAPVYTQDGSVWKGGSTAPEVNWAANGYRLPTEAEWQKAARGGLSGKRFPWGDTITHSQANYSADPFTFLYDVSPTFGYHPSYFKGSMPHTSPVGSFAANGYGLYDMAGNVWQWCWDWYGPYDMGTLTDPRGASSGSRRVLLGGSWGFSASYCRVAVRANEFPTGSIFYIGFRLARTTVP